MEALFFFKTIIQVPYRLYIHFLLKSGIFLTAFLWLVHNAGLFQASNGVFDIMGSEYEEQ